MNELLNLYRAHAGKISDRWLAYVNQYDLLFAPWRDRPVRLLEIGIQNGGSLEIWARYFPNASVLVGCDIDPLCEYLTYDDPRIRIVVGDANSDNTERRITAHSPEWDIVIDDGSHQSRHIVDAFARFFPKVSVGGMFIAEDLHCSYWQEYGGGLADPLSSVAFFKRLADLVNFEHWGIPISRSEYLAGFTVHYGCHFDEAALAQVHSVEFFNSQCVVRKRDAANNLLGPRLIAGTIEKVSTEAKQYEGTVSRVLDQTSNPWSDVRLINLADGDRFMARFMAMEAMLLEARAKLSRQIDQIRDLEVQLAQLTRTLAARESTLQQLADDKVFEELENASKIDAYRARELDLMVTVQARDEQIAALLVAQSKASARIGRLIERGAKKIFPERSLRRRVLARMLGFADAVYHQGLSGALRSSRRVGGDVARIHNFVIDDSLAQPPEFAAWIRAHEPDDGELARQRLASAPYNATAPMFSVILPVYKIPSAVLETTIASVRNQTWQDWEMCVVYADVDNTDNWALLERLAIEEPRLKVRRLAENGGISRNSNAALGFACGEFVALLDHDDELTPWALHDMAIRIAAVPDADFLFSDKDSINASGTLRQNPLFKPSWSPEMMFSVNYLTHLCVLRRSIVQAVGGWNPETDGAQDWDLFFRVAEKSRRIERVPGIHYHWRIIEGSTATGIGAKPYALIGQLRTLEMRVRRLGLAASVQPNQESGYRLVWHLDGRPEVDVILHGECDDVASVLRLLVDQCEGMLASVTLCWSGLREPPVLPKRLPGGVPFAVVRSQGGDKTGAIADAVDAGSAPAVLLLDVAVKRLARNSLRDLAGWVLKHPEIGFSSALVLLDDDTVVEAGRVVGLGGVTQPLFCGMPLRHWGPIGGPLWYRNIQAAGDTAIAFKRDRLEMSKYRGLSWAQAIVAICADVRSTDRRGVVIPHARAFVERMPALSGAWHESMRNDPYFHPAFMSVVPLALDPRKR
jgi:hypothetical protein